MHWKRAHGKRTKYPIICVTCGVKHLSDRRDGKFCSDVCKGQHYTRKCKLPADHPVMLLIAEARRPKPKPLAFQPERRECAWCGVEFTARVRTQRFCCKDHKVRVVKNKRRGRQYGSTSHFTWAEFIRLHIRLERCCAYCLTTVVGQPDPDHVVPLSKGGSNSITNILPACRACNSDKRDLLLHEWQVDRARRNLEPRTISDPRWTHLTQAILAA